MPGDVYQNWKIENFSCWNKDVHVKFIRSPIFFNSFCEYLELYPRGVSGLDEHLVVGFCEVKSNFPGGKFSFIGSDGSIFCSLQVIKVSDENPLMSPSGPKYKDVIDQIGIDDQLSVQFFPLTATIHEQRMCTTIDMSQIILDIDETLIEFVKPGIKYTFFSGYTSNKLVKGFYLKVYNHNKKMQFLLEPYRKVNEAFYIQSRMKLLGKDDTLQRLEENKHVFLNEQPWTFSDSLTIEELVDKDSTLEVCLKIAKGYINEKYNNLSFSNSGVNIQRNTNDCKSCKGLESFSAEQAGDSVKNRMDNDSTSNPIENSVSALSKELMGLYQDHDFSDLQIECGGVSFPVHKNVLSARSPVFKCLLSSDMREAASGKVEITDVDVPTCCRFLGFLYSGTVDDLEGESAVKLYYAADKYQVPTLKRDCVEFLLANVSLSNVCDVLSLADKHQDDTLMSAAHDFMLNNFNEVARSEEWRGFMKSHSLLVAETLTHFAAQDFVQKK